MPSHDDIKLLEEIEGVPLGRIIDDYAYKCIDCSRFFFTRTGLENHPCEYYRMKIDETKRRFLTPKETLCNKCSPALVLKDKIFICNECMYLYIDKNIEIEPPKGDVVYHVFKCNKCKFLFTRTCNLKKYKQEKFWRRAEHYSSRAFMAFLLVLASSIILSTFTYCIWQLIKMYSY